MSQQHTRVSLYYGDHVHWVTIITSTGALAIVIAFIQLGNQREDRLRAQIGKIGVWTQADDLRTAPDQPEWHGGAQPLACTTADSAGELPRSSGRRTRQ